MTVLDYDRIGGSDPIGKVWMGTTYIFLCGFAAELPKKEGHGHFESGCCIVCERFYSIHDVIQYDLWMSGDTGVQPEEAGEEALGRDDRKPKTANHPLACSQGDNIHSSSKAPISQSCIRSCNFPKHNMSLIDWFSLSLLSENF